MDKTSKYGNKLLNYLYNVGNSISSLKLDLFEETKTLFPTWSGMTTEVTQGELLRKLVMIGKCKKGIEIGVFTGYSSICLAEGLPSDGKLYCLDVSEEYTNIAQKYWKLTGVDSKCELILGSGVETLETFLENDSNRESFDFAYVDADKTNYLNYHELLLKLLKPGGFIVYDNTLWSLKVLEKCEDDESTISLQNLNLFLRTDDRVDSSMLYFADGVNIVVKK